MSEYGLAALLGGAIALIVGAVISWALNFFVALNSRPTKRAAIVSGISGIPAVAVLLSMVIATASGSEASAVPYLAWTLFGALAATILIFLYWRTEYRRCWIENDADIEPDDELANHDWRIGLMELGLVLTLIVGWFLYKMLRAAV